MWENVDIIALLIVVFMTSPIIALFVAKFSKGER